MCAGARFRHDRVREFAGTGRVERRAPRGVSERSRTVWRLLLCIKDLERLLRFCNSLHLLAAECLSFVRPFGVSSARALVGTLRPRRTCAPPLSLSLRPVPGVRQPLGCLRGLVTSSLRLCRVRSAARCRAKRSDRCRRRWRARIANCGVSSTLQRALSGSHPNLGARGSDGAATKPRGRFGRQRASRAARSRGGKSPLPPLRCGSSARIAMMSDRRRACRARVM